MGHLVGWRDRARLRRTAWLRASVCAALALPAATQAQRSQASVVGRVVEQGTAQPVGGVTIRLGESDRTTQTDENGRFLFTAVPLGTHTLLARHLAYRTVESELQIDEAGGTYDVLIRLAADAIPLDPITVTVRDDHGAFTDVRDRIHRMRTLGLGHAFDRQEIEASGAHRLSHLVARLPGVRVQPVPNRAGAGELRLRQRSDCAPSLYVDGMLVPMDGASVDDVVAIRDAEFVEVYRRLSDLPGEFADERALHCGAIAVWMRRGTESGERFGFRRVLAVGAFAFLAFFVFGRGF